MADHLEILALCRSAEDAHVVAELLAPLTRPDFEEDVSAGRMRLYKAICALDYPEEVAVEGSMIRAYWSECDTQLRQAESALSKGEVQVQAAFVVEDGAESGSSEDMEGSYYLLLDGKLTKLSSQLLAQRFPGRDVPSLGFEDFTQKLEKLRVLLI